MTWNALRQALAALPALDAGDVLELRAAMPRVARAWGKDEGWHRWTRLKDDRMVALVKPDMDNADTTPDTMTVVQWMALTWPGDDPGVPTLHATVGEARAACDARLLAAKLLLVGGTQ